MKTKNQHLIKFGKKVRNHREKNNLSQEELAFRAGIHRTYIGAIERGERNLSLINIIRIASALEVEPKSLFENWYNNG